MPSWVKILIRIKPRANVDVRAAAESLQQLGSITAVASLGAGWEAINNSRRKHCGPGWSGLTWERACCVGKSSCRFSLLTKNYTKL